MNLGLKTRYVDMYEGYVNSASADSDIANFKELLKADAPGYETWGDFEMAMARHAAGFKSADVFVKCVRDFRKYLTEYLAGENAKFLKLYDATSEAARICVAEFEDSLHRFFGGQIPNVTNAIQRSLESLNGIQYNFVVFNYTTVLDYVVSARQAKGGGPDVDVVHIHGRIGTDVTLGVDNIDQFKNLPYSITRKMQRTFVKPYFNQSYDTYKLEKTIGMICDSHVICVYGLALGESDRMWVDALIGWLKVDKENHLIYYAYSNKNYEGVHPEEVMDDEDELKLQLLNRICKDSADVSAVIDRVHIPIGKSLFNFSQKLQNPPAFPKTPGSIKSM